MYARPPCAIFIRGVERYAHVLINGRGEIRGRHRPFLNLAAVFRAAADDLTMA